MDRFAPHLQWIDGQRERMIRLVVEWAQINSGSHNLAGLERCGEAFIREAARLAGNIELIDLPPQRLPGLDGQLVDQPLGRLIRITSRSSAPLRVLLGIHIDTVYGVDHPFQAITPLDGQRLRGPGVADAKGGLIVMLTALEAFERFADAGRIGWEVIVNPDEELGSPGSAALWAAAARRNHLGLLYEPAQEDGALVGARKGSGHFSAVIAGKAAHAGRNPGDGRNAIHAMARFIARLEQLALALPGATVNVGLIEGGTSANVVPDRALCRFNVRIISPGQQRMFSERLEAVVADFDRMDGISLQINGSFTAPPRPLDEPMRRLLEQVAACGRELGIPIDWRDSGGVCDGNRLAAAGLPNVDSLGVRGGAIHSPDEYICLDSLTERARLSALLLMKLAAGELSWPTDPQAR
jgi:glutamate carboxypeptidase